MLQHAIFIDIVSVYFICYVRVIEESVINGESDYRHDLMHINALLVKRERECRAGHLVKMALSLHRKQRNAALLFHETRVKCHHRK